MLHNSQTDNIIRTKMRSSPWILLTYIVQHLHNFSNTNKLFNSMWQRPTWEVNRLSASQEVPSIPYYFKLKMHPTFNKGFLGKNFCKQIHCTACKIYDSFCKANCSSRKIIFETFKEWKNNISNLRHFLIWSLENVKKGESYTQSDKVLCNPKVHYIPFHFRRSWQWSPFWTRYIQSMLTTVWEA